MLSIPSVTRIIFFLALCSGSVTICFNLVRRCWDSNTQRSACEANAQIDCGTAATKTPLLAKCPIGLSLIFTFAKNAFKKNYAWQDTWNNLCDVMQVKLLMDSLGYYLEI